LNRGDRSSTFLRNARATLVSGSRKARTGVSSADRFNGDDDSDADSIAAGRCSPIIATDASAGCFRSIFGIG
jgi:hypothetical protein